MLPKLNVLAVYGMEHKTYTFETADRADYPLCAIRDIYTAFNKIPTHFFMTFLRSVAHTDLEQGEADFLYTFKILNFGMVVVRET